MFLDEWNLLFDISPVIFGRSFWSAFCCICDEVRDEMYNKTPMHCGFVVA